MNFMMQFICNHESGSLMPDPQIPVWSACRIRLGGKVIW
jgi:hypothetical protein